MTGRILNRLSKDIYQLDFVLPTVFFSIFSTFTMFVQYLTIFLLFVTGNLIEGLPSPNYPYVYGILSFLVVFFAIFILGRTYLRAGRELGRLGNLFSIKKIKIKIIKRLYQNLLF